MVAELGNEQVRRCSHNRSVHFPADDALLISGYHEAPSNAFHLHQSHTVAVITDAYRKACERQQVSPNESVERQIACFHQINGLRQECLSLKGQRLSQAHMECLEEILKRVQFDTLDFEYTFIDDDAAVSLAEMLEFYDSTVKLNLSFNKQISIRGWQAIFLAIKNCPSLQFLNLRYTSLSDRVVPVLTRTLRTQPSLTVLHIENVSLSGKGLLLLVSALKTNTILRELYLGENNLQPTDGSQLHQLIVGNSSIQILDLRNNQLQDAGAAHIFDALKNSDAIENSALSALVLWNNRLTSASMGALACGLMKNDRLETLNIGSNDLSVDGITALKPALLANTSLQRLGLQATGLDCECAIVLAECIADNKVLVRIDLRDNANIGSAGLLALHLAMKMNTSITLLDLDYSCTNSKVKEYDDEFRKYFSEIKEFCERNKKIALDKLTVQAELPKDGDDALSEEPECNLQLFEEEEEGEKKAPVENKVTGEEEKAGKSEEDKPLNRRPNGFGLNSTQRRRPVFKLTRSSSLTCAELVEDLSERIVQMSRSLTALDESSLDAGPIASKHNLNNESSMSSATAPSKELVKSPSLPILVDRNLGNDAAVPVKRKPRRFSVSVVPTSSSNPDIYRSSSPRFKVERVVLSSVKAMSQPVENSLTVSNKPLGDGKPNNISSTVAKVSQKESSVTGGISSSESVPLVSNNNIINVQRIDEKVGEENVCMEKTVASLNLVGNSVNSKVPEKKLIIAADKEDFKDSVSLGCKAGGKLSSDGSFAGAKKNADCTADINEDFDPHASISSVFNKVCESNLELGDASHSFERSNECKKFAVMDLPSTSNLKLFHCKESDCKVSQSLDIPSEHALENNIGIKECRSQSEHCSIDFEMTTSVTSVDCNNENRGADIVNSEVTSVYGGNSIHKCYKKDCSPSTSKVDELMDEEVILGIVKDLVNYTVYEVEKDEFIKEFSMTSARSAHLASSSVTSFGMSTRHSLKSSTAAYKEEEEKAAVRGVIRRLVREVLFKEKELVQDTLRRKRERIQMGITRELT